MRTTLVTLAVPAYRRAKMVAQIIHTFKLQTLRDTELLVVDDCVDDTTVRDVVSSHAAKDSRIRIHKNSENLGFGRNFLNALELAHGDYIVVLGDDDLLARTDSLERYVQVFETFPDVGYVYPNGLQINEAGDVDYAFRHFERDQYFAPGLPSLASTWLRSCFIPGIGLRSTCDFRRAYPEDDMLFPQVEMIGKLLASHASYGISDFLVAGRAHSGQLGFAAMKGERIKGGEQHSVVEFEVIADRLAKLYHELLNIDVSIEIHRIVRRYFRHAQATVFPTTRLNVGARRTSEVFVQAVRNDPSALADGRFVGYFLLSLVVPPQLLMRLKEARKRQVVQGKFSEERQRFDRMGMGL